jgi:hypothetical protein
MKSIPKLHLTAAAVSEFVSQPLATAAAGERDVRRSKLACSPKRLQKKVTDLSITFLFVRL